MSSYYYLVATLPMLRYEDSSPMSHEAFLELCHGNISDSDYRLVCSASLSSSAASDAEGGKSHPFLRKWEGFRDMVAKELNDQRARKLELGGDRYKNDGDKEYRISETVRAALAASNPLQGELLLMQLYWKYLDDLSGLHTFDIEALLAYAVKLQILERKSRFTLQEGNSEFKRLFSNLQSKIKSI